MLAPPRAQGLRFLRICANSVSLSQMPFWPFRQNVDPFDQVLKLQNDEDFSLFACGADAPSESDIQAFESAIGVKLPDDFRRFSKSKLGGIYIEVKETIWPRAKALHVGPFWSFLYGMFVHGFGKDIPEWMDIRLATQQFRSESGTNYVPCLKIVGNADVFCFDSAGRLRQWDHETGEAELQNCTFTELFAKQVTELRKRKDQKKAGEDQAGISQLPLP
jgi:hypothetical protein